MRSGVNEQLRKFDYHSMKANSSGLADKNIPNSSYTSYTQKVTDKFESMYMNFTEGIKESDVAKESGLVS